MSPEFLTSRGRSSRDRIITQAAQLVGEKGVRGTSLDDICTATPASKSQLYHYFRNKEELILAVIERQTSKIFAVQHPLIEHLDTWENLDRWCALLIGLHEAGYGGCPIGSLASELADHDEGARVALVASFDQWETYLAQGFTCMRERGDLRAEADPVELAIAVMTSLQGGILLTQTRRTTRPLQVALHTALAYVRSFASTTATTADL